LNLKEKNLNPAEDKLHDTGALIDELRAGRMVILMDDEDRENEGDLVLAAEKVTPEAINFMAREARGLIWDFSCRSRAHHSGGGESISQARGHCHPRSCFSPAGSSRWGIAAGRSHRSRLRSGASGGFSAGGGDSGNHE